MANILKSKSAAGLSLAASYGEVIMYSNAAFYNILRGNPFTAYGETFVVQLQTMIIVGLIWLWKDDPKVGGDKIGAVLGAFMLYLFVVFKGEDAFDTLSLRSSKKIKVSESVPLFRCRYFFLLVVPTN